MRIKSLTSTLLCVVVMILRCDQAESEVEGHGANLTVALLIPSSVAWLLGNEIAAAIIPATEEIKRRRLLPDYNVNWIIKDTACVANKGFQAAIDAWRSVDHLDAIIGAACSVVCQPVSLLTAAWNIPIVSYSCTSSALSNKYTYPTFTRVMGTEEMMTPLINALMDEFHWDRCAVVSTTETLYTNVALETKRVLEAAGKRVFYHVIKPQMNGDTPDLVSIEEQRAIIRTLQTEARLICLFMYSFNKRVFMVTAYEEGMLNGDYIYFGNEVLSVIDNEPSYRPELSNELVFEGFLGLSSYYQTGPAVDQLIVDIVAGFEDPLFEGYDHLEPTMELMLYGGLLYDAVILWAYGVNQTLLDGGAPDDGLAITSNIFNSSIRGGITGNITIDYKGDRKMDQLLTIIQPGLQVVEMFHWHAAAGWLEKLYHPESADDWTGLYWGAGSTTVPTGAPPCGWQRELCPPRPKDITVSVMTGIVLVMLVLLSLGLTSYLYLQRYRKAILREAQQSFVDIKEIRVADWQARSLHHGENAAADSNLNDVANVGSTSSRRVPLGGHQIESSPRMRHLASQKQENEEGMSSTNSSRRSIRLEKTKPSKVEKVYFHVDSSMADAISTSGTLGGVLRNTEVAVRAYTCASVRSDDAILLNEICQMRLLRHNNLNRFVAISVTEPLLLILTEYAPRGSVRNLIDDPQTRLSWELKISLVTDITFGMHALHNSSVRYHGHLTSANCVVDRRWVCKITDYGFESIRRRTRTFGALPDDKKLWTAPEILRAKSGFSREGDIYSFGIIVQEIVMQSLPFEDNFPHLSSSDIIEAVKRGSKPPHRPFIDPAVYQHRWINLADKCWDEDPTKRLSPSGILQEIKMINNGTLPHLVDMMIQNLEKHTDALEELVVARNAELTEEQCRMDCLLGELLPARVLKQLKEGRQVVPESFDQVSLFCSDIVGFTSVCAGSTPIQVVKMLNALYHKFDRIINNYDVYKVATIGDAYIVASGVPLRNGEKHAPEIASMALDMLHVVRKFEIPHIPQEKLHIRIALHTGPCVAGVTGNKTPRYLLFGETVDTGTRLEAGGEAMKIHVSQPCAELLMNQKEYNLELRGDMKLKGVGTMRTYWLLGRVKERDM